MIKMFKSWNLFIKVCIVIVLNFILIFLFDLKFDLTQDKRHTISFETKEILSNLDDKIFIKIYLEGELNKDMQYLQDEIISLLTSFKIIAGNNFDYEFINPDIVSTDIQGFYNQISSDGVISRTIDKNEGFKVSQQVIFPGAVVYYKDQKKAINFLKYSNKNLINKQDVNTSIENLEYKFISAFYRIIQSSENKKQKIAFLNGNGELSEKELFDLTTSNDDNNLQYHYDLDFFNIKKYKVDTSTIGNGYATVSVINHMVNNYKAIIIAQPKIPYTKLEKLIIDQYLMRGGRIIWFVDGVSADIDSLNKKASFVAYKKHLNLDDMFKHYGINIGSNLIEDLESTTIPIVNSKDRNIQNYFKWPYFLFMKSNNSHPIVNNIGPVHGKFVSSIDTINIKSNKKTVILNSSPKSRINPTPAKISFQIAIKPPPKETFKLNKIPVGVLVEGIFESFFQEDIKEKNKFVTKSSKKSKMIFFSDGDLPKNRVVNNGVTWSPLGYDEFSNNIYSGNKNIIMNSIHYLCDDINIFKLKHKKRLLSSLDKKKINKFQSIIQIINIILPIILVCVFSLLFKIYKNKKYA